MTVMSCPQVSCDIHVTVMCSDLHHLGLDPLRGVLSLTVTIVLILKDGQVGVGVVILPGEGHVEVVS